MSYKTAIAFVKPNPCCAHPARRLLALTLVGILLGLLGGCDTSTSSSTVEYAEVELSLSPSPVVASPSTEPDYDWMIGFTVTLTETAGTGATIDAISGVLNESSGGIQVVSGEDEEVLINVQAVTNRVEANGSVAVEFMVHYTLPGGGREAIVKVSVQVVDDNDNVLSYSVTGDVI